MEYVSRETYDQLVERMQNRQAAVRAAQRRLTKAVTLAEKIEAQRALKAAQNENIRAPS